MKRTLLAGTMVLASVVSYSQTIIPKVGLTLSTFSGDDVEKGTRSKVGFTAGVAFNKAFGDGMFSIQPELNYVQKGSQVEYVSEHRTDKVTLGYLELPLLVKVAFGDEDNNFYLNAGPSFAFGLGGKQKIEKNGTSDDVPVKFGSDGDDLDKYYVENGMDIGLQVGAGVAAAGIIMIDVRYGMGLTELYEGISIKNSVLQVSVGYPISLGGGGGRRRR